MSTYTPLASITLTSSASSITFSGYDMSYTDLVLVSVVTCSTADGNQRMTVNGDSSSIYSTTRIAGNGSTATSGRYTSLAYFLLSGGAINPPSSASGQILITNFMNYSNTTTYKSILVKAGNASGSTYPGVESNVELYRSTNAISSFTLSTDSATFSSGSTFSLYGIQAGTPKAQGGDIVTTDGTYWYHAFKSSGLFTPSTALTADYLVVAGGGGSSSFYAQSGGGGGGLRAVASQSLSAQNYGVTVGAGGQSGYYATYYQVGGNGSNSSFDSFAVTGGGGGAYGSTNGSSGGSGGGTWTGSVGAGNAGSYSPVEGYAGSSGSTDNVSYTNGGAGGGAGGIAANADGSSRAGNGGAGANSYNSITFTTWLTATNTGVSGYLAGGGGGGAQLGAGGTAGSGGGGAGGTAAGTAGTANTGGGGGGGNGTINGKNGGSGLVIIRYAV